MGSHAKTADYASVAQTKIHLGINATVTMDLMVKTVNVSLTKNVFEYQIIRFTLHIFKSWDRLHIEDEQQYSPLVQVVKLKIQRVRVVRVVKLCEWFKW